MCRKIELLLPMLLVGSAGLTFEATGETINIAFHNGATTVGGFNTRPDGTLVSAGANGTDTWNNVQNNTGVGLSFTGFALSQADGTGTAATLDVTAGFATFNNNGWGTQSDDYVMMEGWYGFRDNEFITISNLPSAFTSAGYTVAIYGDANVTDGRVMDYVIGGTTKTLTDNNNFAGTFVEGGSGPGDNYVVFSGLNAASFTITGNTTNAGRSAVNGIIIQAVPEPGSIAMLGLGGLFVSRRHRRPG